MNNSLRSGELDLVIQQESPDQLGQFEDDPTYTITEGNSIRKWVWTFNNQMEPFTDVRVRQGLYKAISRDAILTAVWGDRGEVIGRSEEHTSELQSRGHLVCRLPLGKNKTKA